MKKPVTIIVSIGVILILVIVGVILISQSTRPGGEGEGPTRVEPKPPAPPKVVTIRLGYSPYSIINAHLGQALAHTNILENNSLKGEIQTYDSDSLLNEALKKGELDAVFTADVPAMLALAQGYKGLIVTSIGSLGRTALMVLPDSPIEKSENLVGSASKIGVAFGSPAHRNLHTMLQNEGLSIGQDVHLIDVPTPQRLITGLENRTFDAIMLCDPQVEQYLRQGTYRNVADRQFYSVILMARDFHNQNPAATMRLLTALKEAIFFTAERRVDINKLVANRSGVPSDIIVLCASINLNLRATSITRVNISLVNYRPLLQSTANYIHQQGLAPQVINISEVTDPKIQAESARIISPDQFDLAKIKFTP